MLVLTCIAVVIFALIFTAFFVTFLLALMALLICRLAEPRVVMRAAARRFEAARARLPIFMQITLAIFLTWLALAAAIHWWGVGLQNAAM